MIVHEFKIYLKYSVICFYIFLYNSKDCVIIIPKSGQKVYWFFKYLQK